MSNHRLFPYEYTDEVYELTKPIEFQGVGNRLELFNKLKFIQLNDKLNFEEKHQLADMALLHYVGDLTIVQAFDDIDKWYS